MSEYEGLAQPFQPDWQGLIDNLLRKGTPRRVYHIELFQDPEIQQALAERFDLAAGLPEDDEYERRKYIAVQRFCGFDYVRCMLPAMLLPHHTATVDDTAALARPGGRVYRDEHTGPIGSSEDFEKFPWPDPTAAEVTEDVEWYQENLPEDMCIILAGGLGHFAEDMAMLMGYETLCYALYEQRDLVAAIARKLREVYSAALRRVLAFDRVRIIWGSDDMGFRTGTLISPDDLRVFALSGHKELAAMAHAAGRPYLLHSCGMLTEIMDDLIDDVGIDGKHSFEDTIENVCRVKHTYGRRIALLGGIDVDFLCRNDPQAIRSRVRRTLDVCQEGGGYCLGTGNTVSNYIPLDNYLAMIDEGRSYC